MSAPAGEHPFPPTEADRPVFIATPQGELGVLRAGRAYLLREASAVPYQGPFQRLARCPAALFALVEGERQPVRSGNRVWSTAPVPSND